MCLTIHPDGGEPTDAKVYWHYIARARHVFLCKPPTTQETRTLIFFILKSRGVQTRKPARASPHFPPLPPQAPAFVLQPAVF